MRTGLNLCSGAILPRGFHHSAASARNARPRLGRRRNCTTFHVGSRAVNAVAKSSPRSLCSVSQPSPVPCNCDVAVIQQPAENRLVDVDALDFVHVHFDRVPFDEAFLVHDTPVGDVDFDCPAPEPGRGKRHRGSSQKAMEAISQLRPVGPDFVLRQNSQCDDPPGPWLAGRRSNEFLPGVHQGFAGLQTCLIYRIASTDN